MTDTSDSKKFPVALWIVPALLAIVNTWMFLSAFGRPSNDAAQAPPQVQTARFPRTVTDDAGRHITIPTRPIRIIPCNSGMADLAAAFVDPARICAVPGLVIDYAGAGEFYKQHKEIAHFEKFDAETLLAFHPDLVLTSSFQDPATVLILEQRHIPILRFKYFQSIEAIRASIFVIGSAVGEESKAQELADDFIWRLKNIERAIAGRPQPRVLAYSNYGTGSVVGSGESQDEIMRRAGARNAAVEMNLVGHQAFTFEQMLNLNPDWIVVAGDTGLDSPQARIVLNEPGLAGLSAVKARRIAVIPDRAFAAVSHYVADAVEILARQLHPDAFPGKAAP